MRKYWMWGKVNLGIGGVQRSLGPRNRTHSLNSPSHGIFSCVVWLTSPWGEGARVAQEGVLWGGPMEPLIPSYTTFPPIGPWPS